jgi:hypothetical protein
MRETSEHSKPATALHLLDQNRRIAEASSPAFEASPSGASDPNSQQVVFPGSFAYDPL